MTTILEEPPPEPWGWHPSHRIFHDDEGAWRCACGRSTGRTDNENGSNRWAICFVHARADLSDRLHQEILDDIWTDASEEASARWAHQRFPWGPAEFRLRRTEPERCAWLAEVAAQAEIDGTPDVMAARSARYMAPSVDDTWDRVKIVFYLNAVADAQYFRYLLVEREISAHNNREIIEQTETGRAWAMGSFPAHGGIVRLGCPEREADGVTPRR